MASITIILLPLLTLFILQLQFLAYQSEIITWGQRFAIWLDLAQLLYFWRSIFVLGGIDLNITLRWFTFRQQCLGRIRDSITPLLLWVGLLLVFCGKFCYVVAGLIVLLLSAVNSTLYKAQKINRIVKIVTILVLALMFTVMLKSLIVDTLDFSAAFKWLLSAMIISLSGITLISFGRRHAPQGSIILLLAAELCLPLSLGLQADGERLEKLLILWPSNGEKSTLFSRLIINDKRILNLQEQRLFANHPDPQTIAQLHSEDWQKALQKIEPVNLQDRSLRHANFENALLCSADLRNTDLCGADLDGADLRNARLSDSQLQKAFLHNTKLQKADLYNAELQQADLQFANLQGAILIDTHLQSANLSNSYLQATDMHKSHLQGANMCNAHFQGANLSEAEMQASNLANTDFQAANLYQAIMQGSNLSGAKLHAANLYQANLEGAILNWSNIYGIFYSSQTNLNFIDARDLIWTPLTKEALAEINDKLKKGISIKDGLAPILDDLQKASSPNAPKPTLQSCLATGDLQLPCVDRYDSRNPKELAEFKGKLHPLLADLAAESPDIARGIISQIHTYYNNESSRAGLATILVKQLEAGNAPGLQALSDDEKADLRELAKMEQESLKK
jgi:uncharacterized protein YjbI with pentapeptide repeats